MTISAKKLNRSCSTGLCMWSFKIKFHKIISFRFIRDDTHMTSMKICPIFKPSDPTCPSTSKILSAPWPWTSISKWTPWTPYLHMITNQLHENIIQRLLGSSFRSAFVFIINLLPNLVWLSFDFFLFSWSLTICFFVVSYSCVCSCRKISHNYFFIYNYSHF